MRKGQSHRGWDVAGSAYPSFADEPANPSPAQPAPAPFREAAAKRVEMENKDPFQDDLQTRKENTAFVKLYGFHMHNIMSAFRTLSAVIKG